MGSLSKDSGPSGSRKNALHPLLLLLPPGVQLAPTLRPHLRDVLLSSPAPLPTEGTSPISGHLQRGLRHGHRRKFPSVIILIFCKYVIFIVCRFVTWDKCSDHKTVFVKTPVSVEANE